MYTDLRYAGTALKKFAYTQGIRVGRHGAWFQVVPDSARVRAIVGDDRSPDGIEVTTSALEYMNQFSWREIKAGRV